MRLIKYNDITIFSFTIIIFFIVIIFGNNCSSKNEDKTSIENKENIDEYIPLNELEIKKSSFNLNQLTYFYHKLRLLKQGKIKKVRILHFGDSHISCDWFTRVIRNRLTKKFGYGGIGFIPIGKPNGYHYRPASIQIRETTKTLEITDTIFSIIPFSTLLNLSHEQDQSVNIPNKSWYYYRFLYSDKHKNEEFKTNCPKGYGLGGICTVGIDNKSIIQYQLSQPFTHFELWFLNRPKGGKFNISIDEETNQINTASNQPQITKYDKLMTKGYQKVRIVPLDENGISLYGMILENDRKGIVYDNLGMDSARIDHITNLDWSKSLTKQIKWRNPDLIILSYGTNSVNLFRRRPLTYQRNLKHFIKNIQNALGKKVNILILGPPDMSISESKNINNSDGLSYDDWITHPGLKKILQAQINVCKAENLGYISLYQLMGGEGSMINYVEKGLGQIDHVHLTGNGYKHLAQKVFQILMTSYNTSK